MRHAPNQVSSRGLRPLPRLGRNVSPPELVLLPGLGASWASSLAPSPPVWLVRPCEGRTGRVLRKQLGPARASGAGAGFGAAWRSGFLDTELPGCPAAASAIWSSSSLSLSRFDSRSSSVESASGSRGLLPGVVLPAPALFRESGESMRSLRMSSAGARSGWDEPEEVVTLAGPRRVDGDSGVMHLVDGVATLGALREGGGEV